MDRPSRVGVNRCSTFYLLIIFDKYCFNFTSFHKNLKQVFATSVQELISKMAEKSTSDYTLPASWFTNEKIFELEKRAIFSKVCNSILIYRSVPLTDLNSHGFWQCTEGVSTNPEIIFAMTLPASPLSSSWGKTELFKPFTMCVAIEHTRSSIKTLEAR
jgi:hypothetical protein